MMTNCMIIRIIKITANEYNKILIIKMMINYSHQTVVLTWAPHSGLLSPHISLPDFRCFRKLERSVRSLWYPV